MSSKDTQNECENSHGRLTRMSEPEEKSMSRRTGTVQTSCETQKKPTNRRQEGKSGPRGTPEVQTPGSQWRRKCFGGLTEKDFLGEP